MTVCDGQWLMAASLVLVRQMPGSAKGVVFLTIEDKTGVADVVVWPKLFERSCRVLLGSSMLAINGRLSLLGSVVEFDDGGGGSAWKLDNGPWWEYTFLGKLSIL